VYPTWEHHPRLIEYLGYDSFVSCGLRDPYGNEPLGVAFLSSATLGEHIRTRRLELKMTVKKCAQILKVDAKTVHGWERNTHRPSRSMKSKVIHFMGYNPFISSKHLRTLRPIR
jgi:DNA-binding XRE family transcriptional regulator